MKRRPTVASLVLTLGLIGSFLFTALAGISAAPASGESTGGGPTLSTSSSAWLAPNARVDTSLQASPKAVDQTTVVALDRPNAASQYFVTNPWDSDFDHDGLTDGEEKLYGSDPNDTNSPGIYIEYTNDMKTGKYFTWEQHGAGFIARSAAVVRRGTTFFVGGPSDATLEIQKSGSGLTTLTAQRDWGMGRWRIAIPGSGTVGKYTLTLSKPGWSQSMKLYVIFELPSTLNAADTAAFEYSDDPSNYRDEYAIWFMTTDDSDPGNQCPGGDPNCHLTAGRGFAFQLDQYKQYVFENHVIDVINGYTTQAGATSALGHHVDGILRLEPTSLWLNMYDALHDYWQNAQCSTHASVLTSFLRGAGIPARPIISDWDMSRVGSVLFDHSTEVYYRNNWQVMRAYLPSVSEPITTPIAHGIIEARSRNNWIYWPPNSDLVYRADSNWEPSQMETDYENTQNQFDYVLGSWDHNKIVKWDWVKTELGPYWGWPEPQKMGNPYEAWIPWPRQVVTGTNQTGTPLNTVTGPVQLDQVKGDRGVDLDGDKRLDQLVVDVQVNANTPGYYTIGGLLSGANAEVYPKINGIAAASTYTYLKAGTQTVQLSFDGRTIFRSRVNGPYRVKSLWISDLKPDADPMDLVKHTLDQKSTDYTTAAYQVGDFENLGANLVDKYREGTVGNGNAGLSIGVEFAISAAGTYSVTADLVDSRGQVIGSAAWSGSSSPALLEFKDIRGTTGPYTLKNLRLLNSSDRMVDSRSAAYTTMVVTQGQPKSQLLGQVPPTGIGPRATITNTYSAAGVDANGNGLYDLLRITVGVQIAPGEGGQSYKIEGGLVDPYNNVIAWVNSTPHVLAEGVQALTLDFDGRFIRQHGFDGAFTLVGLKLIRTSSRNVLDQQAVAYTTPSYDHLKFEEPVVAPATVGWEDSLEKDAGNWDVQSIWTLSEREWNSSLHALKVEVSGHATDTLTGSPIDISKLAQPTLHFNTSYGMAAGDSGSLELSSDGVNWTRVATYTGSTNAWTSVFVDLSPWEHATALQMRFNVASQNFVAWYLDDFYVFGLPGIASASFTNTPDSGPIGTNFDFLAQYNGSRDLGPITYRWDFGDGSTQETSSPAVSHRYSSPASYSARLTLQAQYDTHTVSKSVLVYQVLTGTSYTLNPSLPRPGDVVTFHSSFQPADATTPVSYTWDFGDGSAPVETSSSTVTHAYDSLGLYTVTITASNGYGSPVTHNGKVLVGRLSYIPIISR